MPSLWCLLLLSPVFFLSHHNSSVVFHQTTVHNNRCLPNHRSILHGVIAFTSEQTLLSYPQFPSLPTSSQVELVPIHVSFGCDTILLVIVWWLCFSGVVRGPLSLDSSWHPHLPASASCTQSTSSFQTSLSNEVLLFLIKTSFISCALTICTCLFQTIIIPRVLTGRRAKGVMQKVLFGSVLCS